MTQHQYLTDLSIHSLINFNFFPSSFHKSILFLHFFLSISSQICKRNLGHLPILYFNGLFLQRLFPLLNMRICCILLNLQTLPFHRPNPIMFFRTLIPARGLIFVLLLLNLRIILTSLLFIPIIIKFLNSLQRLQIPLLIHPHNIPLLLTQQHTPQLFHTQPILRHIFQQTLHNHRQHP